MEDGPALERRPGYKADEELELRHRLAHARRNSLKTKFLLGAIVVAVLAVFGVIGLQQTKTTEAGNVVGITGCNGTIVVQGGTCDFSVTLFDDISASSVTVTAAAGTLSSVSIAPTCAVAATGGGSVAVNLADAGCDANTTSEQYVWTII
jgi:hypothetical protein